MVCSWNLNLLVGVVVFLSEKFTCLCIFSGHADTTAGVIGTSNKVTTAESGDFSFGLTNLRVETVLQIP